MIYFLTGIFAFCLGLWRRASLMFKLIIIFLLFFIAARCKTVVTKTDTIHAERLEALAEAETDPDKKDIMHRAAVALRHETKRADTLAEKANTLESAANRWAVSKWWLAGAGLFAVLLGFVFIRFRQ